MGYNFCWPHGTLTAQEGRKTTPAMAAGLEERPWTMLDVVERMDDGYPIGEGSSVLPHVKSILA